MQPLIPNATYHIFNHANGFENIFREKEYYRYFLEKYQLHILPIAETYAYSLLQNCFCLLVLEQVGCNFQFVGAHASRSAAASASRSATLSRTPTSTPTGTPTGKSKCAGLTLNHKT